MKKIKLNESGKTFLFVVAMFVLVIGSTMLYLKQIDRVNNGELYVVCDCEMDK